MWNLSNKDETSAILKPDCKKLTGFPDEDFTESGKFLSSMMQNFIYAAPEAAPDKS